MNPEQLQIRLLGPLDVLEDGNRLDLPPSRKARALLAYLVASRRPLARSALCDLFWQDVNDPRAGLRWALSKLRGVVDSEDRPRIVASRDRIGFEGEGVEVDLHRVRSAIGRDPAEVSTEALEASEGEFRGDFLEGLDLPSCHQYQAWCIGTREQLRILHVSILSRLTERLRDAPERALPHALRRLALDPYAEAAYVAAMDVLGDLGRVERALEVYERCRRMLAHHMEVPPSAELEAARRRLGSPSRIRSAGAGVRGGEVGARKEGARTREDGGGGGEPGIRGALAALPHPEGLPEVREDEPALVGREAEVEVLRSLVQGAGSLARPSVVLLSGEPGIGKTRLLRELVREVRASGGWALAGQVYETEEIRPYGPWADMLRQVPSAALDAGTRGGLSGLLQGAEPGPREDGPTERTQLFGAVSRLLVDLAGARAPGLLVLDDVQWLDASSAALLHYVTRNLDTSPLLLALGAREAEIEPGSTVAQVIRSLDDAGHLRRIPLRRLDATETGALVRAVDGGLDPEPVFATSEGNPLFALALATSLREGIHTTPTTIEEELQDRLERLDPRALSLLPWAAALGRVFDVPILERVVGRPAPEVVEAVDGLERLGILRAAGMDRYDFSHSLLRQAAYRRPSEPVRRAMHRSIARALDGLDPAEGRLPGAVAHHAALGGLPRLSVQACIEAAEDSLWLFAYDEARVLVERGLSQLDDLPPDARLPLEMGLLRVYSFRTMQDRRRGDVEARVVRLTEEAREAGLNEVVATGHALLMELQYQRGAFDEAGRSSVRAAEVGRESGPTTAIWALAETGACLLLLDQAPEDARRLASEAFALAEEHGVEVEVVALARALLHHHDGELEGASRAFQDVIRLGRRAKNRWWECPAMTRMVMVDLDRGDPESALHRAREAGRLAERMDDEAQAAFARGLAAVAAALIGAGADPNGGSGVRGEPSELEAVDRALKELRDLDSLWMTAHVQAYAAEVELERGRAGEARERAREVLDAARSLGRPSLLAIARGLLARSAAAAGSGDRVDRHLESPEVTRPLHHLSHRARLVIQRAREGIPG
jgi:DNA-binding SARP family transcriptional activator/tetratricopeptide (TPR) repeat protein